MADVGAQESSSVVVETVAKVSKTAQKGPALPSFKSDASKVSSKGMGLKKAYLGKQNQFTVSAQDAGKKWTQCQYFIVNVIKEKLKTFNNITCQNIVPLYEYILGNASNADRQTEIC